jgi:hypothetical protein
MSSLQLVIDIIRLFISFLESVVLLLEDRRAETTLLTPTTTVPRTPSPAPTRIPTSPSAWKGTGLTNAQIRSEYQETGVCRHYCHEVRRRGSQPRVINCPVCGSRLGNQGQK